MVAAVIKPDIERSTNEKARKICLREDLRKLRASFIHETINDI